MRNFDMQAVSRSSMGTSPPNSLQNSSDDNFSLPTQGVNPEGGGSRSQNTELLPAQGLDRKMRPRWEYLRESAVFVARDIDRMGLTQIEFAFAVSVPHKTLTRFLQNRNLGRVRRDGSAPAGHSRGPRHILPIIKMCPGMGPDTVAAIDAYLSYVERLRLTTQ